MNLLRLALAVVCLSQPALLIRVAAAPTETIGFWRLAFVLLLLGPAAWTRRAGWSRLPRPRRWATVGAGTLFFVHLWTFVYAAQNTSVAHCMIAFETHPLWTGLGAWLFFEQRPTARVWLAYALAGAGIWTLFSARHGGGTSTLAGDAAALLSAAAFSSYVLAGKGVRRHLDNVLFTVVCACVVAGLFFAAGQARGVAWTGYPFKFWGAVFALAAVVSIGGHALFTHLLESMDVNLLSCAKLFEPPLAALGAWIALGERPGGRTAAAFALVAAAVALLLTGRDRRLDPAELDD